MFLWARKLKKKEGKEESNLSTLGTFKSGFLAKEKKNYIEDQFSEIQLKIEYFRRLPDLKKCLE